MVWYFYDTSRMWLVLTSVLIVACPCALALVAPFTYGNMVRIFGRQGFYLKNAEVIERMASVDSIVFDKTGTITHGASKIKFIGVLNDRELAWVKVITSASTHPLSSLITKSIISHSIVEIENFKERAGHGVEGYVEGAYIRIGSAEYTDCKDPIIDSSRVFVSINDEARGYFQIETTIRPQVEDVVLKLGRRVVALLSGDSDGESNRMKGIFHNNTKLLFNQSPHEKLGFVSALQQEGSTVMMIGDGLNDSGALQQSDVGIAVSDDAGIFNPACDGILAGQQLGLLDKFLTLSKRAIVIVKIGFGISFFYNLIALSLAVGGFLTPLKAAILMPISSISVVAFSTVAVMWVAKQTFKETK